MQDLLAHILVFGKSPIKTVGNSDFWLAIGSDLVLLLHNVGTCV